MENLIQLFYSFALIITCMSSENGNIPPMSGFYTDGLDQALDKVEIVYPERVSKDGSFVSYYLPHYYNLDSMEGRPRRTAGGSEDMSGDAIHFFVPIEGEKHHLELWPNLNFLAPGLVIERRDARDVENINKAKISQISQKQCHYNGRIVGQPDSRAALSTCYGLAGYIQLPAGEEYLIEPVKDSKPTYNKEHPHIMYKRSGMKDKHGNSNCLTKGSARDALGDRLQWESIFGNQVKKDYSPINMNDLVRENIDKSSQVSSNGVPPVDKTSEASSPQEKLLTGDQIKFEQGNSNSLRVPQKSYPGNFVHEGMVQPQYDPTKFEKSERFQMEYGNKLKPKPLKEELGSIKLPDINVSPLKQLASQSIDGEHFIHKPGAASFEKGKKLYDTNYEHQRLKRDLSAEFENVDVTSKKYTDLEEKDYKRVNGEHPAQINSYNNIKLNPSVETSNSQINKNEQLHNSEKIIQNMNEGSLIGVKINENTVERLNKDKVKCEHDTDKTYLDSNKNNEQINELNVNIKKEKDNVVNKQDVPVKDSLNLELTTSYNNVKRDIHLDTSEKSWGPEGIIDKENSGVKPDEINHNDFYNVDPKSKLVDDSSLGNNLENSLGGDLNKEINPSQISKNKAKNDDSIMVSAIESVVRDIERTKVKKDISGGLANTPLEDDRLLPIHQPTCSKAPAKYKESEYISQDEIPMKSFGKSQERDKSINTLDDSTNTGPGLIKDNEKTSEVFGESVEKLNKNNVDEIIIKIKTPEGTVSEIKQNGETGNDGLRNTNFEQVMNNVNTKDSVTGQRNKLLSKANDVEKNKRGIDSKSQIEVEDKTNNENTLKSYKDYLAQDLNIIAGTPGQISIEREGKKTNKAKRDDNTIHLVIETEPEVNKGPEGHSSESSGSNLFCQGKNCLEIKPIYLNDTNAGVTSNNTTAEAPKVKREERRELEDDEWCGATTTQEPLRCHDMAHTIFTLELMITVDFKVVKMHEDDDIENFILTIINMVSSNFDDKSLGLNMNVVLVRLILLTTCIKELDSDRFNPEELLENFCTWQVLVNPGRDDHPHHHDLSVFVSKMDKCEGQVMGVSYMTSVCRPDKACIVCVDEGLLLANTITHQIGHSLGAEHDDGQGSGCAPKLPDGTSYHMAPTISETSTAWSVCSKDSVIQFVRTQGSWCLLDFPMVKSYSFPLMLPGQIYSAAQQCRLNFHMTSVPCSIGPFCNKLYCQITDKLCATKGDPPADGTFCAASMWCFHKQCVHMGRRPGAINGEWGPWTEWSLCTRSCGGGVSSSYRVCNNPKPENGGRFCIGERIRHRMCQTKPCQGFTESFRDLQCKRTEDRPFRGKIHNWIQYQSLFINIECALVCQNRKGDVVMRSPVVADGTPCKPGTRNVCITGTCRNVGCDYIIDSYAKEDACGVCHGNGTECKIIQGIFDEPIVKKGLVEFLRIPKDSGMIFVREVAPSSNVIVVSGSINRVFYLNGLGSEDSMAGDVAFGATHGVYEKRGGMERIFIRGPSKEDLIFYILFRDINKGIHYQYAVLDYDPTYIPSYQWQYLDWDTCTDPCSGGSQRAHAKCVEDRGGVVDDKYCTESTRPMDIIRPCNDFPCQAKWWVSVWSDCICTGTVSVMFRSVLCMRANDESGTRVEVVKESECQLAQKPPTQKPCNESEIDTDCAKRSIPDDMLFQAHRDLRRAVNPIMAFSSLSTEDPLHFVSEDAHLVTDQSLSESKESYQVNKKYKISKPNTNKNLDSKGSPSKQPNSKDDVFLDEKKVSQDKLQDNENFRPSGMSKNEGKREPNPGESIEDLPTLSKEKENVKLEQKNSAAFADPSQSDVELAGDDTDIGSKDYEGKGGGETCETTQAQSVCPTEEPTTEPTTTCKQTCAPQPHKKTTCCKTSPHRQYIIKTTLETTTIRPVAVRLDELNINNFALTVVPLEEAGRRKLMPQSDPEFISLGAVGQFGVGDELNATVVSGQEALDLLEFARSNASEEPVILHEDMHN